jgi:hypothetical protein
MLKPKYKLGDYVQLLNGVKSRIKVIKAPTKQVCENRVQRNVINEDGICSYQLEGFNNGYILEKELKKC